MASREKGKEGAKEGRREEGREGVRTRTSVKTLLSPVRLRMRFSFFTTTSRIFSSRA